MRALADFIFQVLDWSVANPIDNGTTAMLLFITGIAVFLAGILGLYYMGELLVEVLN